MPRLMRCQYCGVLQDEPVGAKLCIQCGGELVFEPSSLPDAHSYLQAQLELDQVTAPAGRNVDRYLLVTVRTPDQVPPAEAASTVTGRPPLALAAVLDISGSMRGEKLIQVKEAVRQAVRRLHDGDVFSLTVFSNEVRCVMEPTVVNDALRRTVESALQEIQAGGMTALCGGLELGLEKALARKQETTLVLLLSDGQANVGETDVERVGQRGLRARDHGVTVSTLGVGSDYNEALMAEIATQGGGRFYHVTTAQQITGYLVGELGEVAALVAREAVIQLTVPAGALLTSLSAAYRVGQDSGQASVTIGDLPSAIELEIPLRLTLPAQTPGIKLSVEGTLNYRSPAGHLLHTPLNRVTVRFVEAEAFTVRAGVSAPVASRVLGQLRAASVLSVARAQAQGAGVGAQQAGVERETLRAYAALLGDEAEEELRQVEADLAAVRAPSPAAKATVAAAFSRQRSTKDFGH